MNKKEIKKTRKAILECIAAILSTVPDAKKSLLCGSRLELAMFLKIAFPDGMIAYNPIYSKFLFADMLYDIDGVTPYTEFNMDNYKLINTKEAARLLFDNR